MENKLTRPEFVATHPELFAEISGEFYQQGLSEGIEKGKTDGLVSGAEAERQRIMSVLAQAVSGYEKIIEAAIADGRSTAGDVALLIVSAEKTARKTALDNLKTDAADLLNVIAPAAPALPAAKVEDDPNLPVEERAKARWDKDPKIRTEFRGNFDSYLAYVKNTEAGRVKILGQKE